jgi:hypothetical protein
MIDKLFFVVLILNATGLFSFVAPKIGVSSVGGGMGHMTASERYYHKAEHCLDPVKV